ncbi:MAG: hypothetical protein AB8B63_03295 [Granulosicoccus sp.]
MKKGKSLHSRLGYRQIALSACVVALSGLVSASEIFNASLTNCVNSVTQEERKVELIYQTSDSPIPCSLYYDKGGAREEVASAKNTKGYCENIERKMVQNLVSAGFVCQHSFLGALGTQEKYNIAIDLFGGSNASPAPAPLPQTIYPVDNVDASFVEDIAEDIQIKLEEKYIADLQERLQNDFSEALGAEYLVGVTVNLSLELSVSRVPSGKPDRQELDLPFGADAATIQSKAKGTENKDASDMSSTLANGRFILSSRVFDNEQDAHRFAAEFHNIYPRVQSRVGRYNNGGDWRLVLGVSDNQERLTEALSQLDANTQRYFSTSETVMASTEDNAPVWVPDDWARYAIAGCYARGHTTSLEIADCASVVLDVDSFLSCLAGGVCVPEQFTADMTPEQIDFLEVVGSDDPVAAARGIMINNIRGCETLEEPRSRDVAECVALSILDDDQVQMYECSQRTDDKLGLLGCLGDETLADNLILYERCAVDSLTMAECMMLEVNNEHLNSAARCVNYGDTEAILACVVDSNLDADESRVLSCMSNTSTRSDQAQCLSREYLDKEQAALIGCARVGGSEADFGLCLVRERGVLESNEYRAAECLLAGEVEPRSLLNCAGARFASNELNQCMDADTPLGECFTMETVISDVVASNIDSLIDINAVDNQIAMFRSELYALEGGDLAEVLSDEASAQLFATTEEVAEEVAKDVKKKGAGLLKRLGF